METIQERARRALDGIRCQEHGKVVRLVTPVASGGTGVEAIGRLEVCCATAQALARTEIARVLA